MASTQVHSEESRAINTFEDELISEIVAALRNTGYSELAQLEVIVDGHEICLRGKVSNLHLLHKAEFVVMSLPSVSTFRSEIDVVPNTSVS